MIRRLVLAEGALSATASLELTEELAHYVRDVLRLKLGDRIRLSDGAGLEALAVIEQLTRTQVVLRLEAPPTALPRAPGPAVTLIQGVGKGDKMDQLIRQAAELGVSVVLPVLSARSVAEKSGRRDRWQSIAEDAIRVGGRAHRPRIESPIALSEVLQRPHARLAWVLAQDAAISLGIALAAADPVVLAEAEVELLIGPEGGFEAAELDAARTAGFVAVELGPHTLRTETAGPAALAIILHAGGALGRRS